MPTAALKQLDRTPEPDATPVAATRRPLRVLLIEDYEEDAALLRRHLQRAGYDVHHRQVQTSLELLDAFSDPEAWHLIIADYTLPGFGARDALSMMQRARLDLPFIIVSGTIDETSAVDAMRAGAHDYVLKGNLERLLPAIERELADAERRKERLRTEAELRLVQQRFSATFNQAAVGMAHTTPEGRFLLVNQRLAEVLGATQEDLLLLSLNDFLLSSEQGLDAAFLTEMLAGTRTGYRVERVMIRTDGSVVPVQFTVSMLREASVGGGAREPLEPSLLWVVEDISARKAAERETQELMTRLINSERLAAAGRMANTLAHEINNPLEALTNIFYLLQLQENTPQAQELMAVAARELDRVGHITKSTLSFYRKIPGRTLDLRTMLEEVVQLFSSRAKQHHVDLLTEIAPGVSGVHYDPSLRQVFANLVGNALEAMEITGGRIVVRARLRGGRAVILVSDTGHGISHEHLHVIFEPFFTTKGERGTGLGLWVTRGIVEEHGGTLLLKSTVGTAHHGTTMRITLPAVPAVAPVTARVQ